MPAVMLFHVGERQEDAQDEDALRFPRLSSKLPRHSEKTFFVRWYVRSQRITGDLLPRFHCLLGRSRPAVVSFSSSDQAAAPIGSQLKS
jgi:hypothetical protein